MDIFNYNGKNIELDYSENYIERIRDRFKVTSFSLGILKNYDNVEKKALRYLIKHALGRRSRNRYNLVAISGIKFSSVENIILDGKEGIKLNLEGFAVFRKN
jgi:predicted ATP-dependent Lon-type protease